MGSITRRLLTLAMAGLLVLLAPAVASAQQYPPSGGEEQPEARPGTVEPEPAAEQPAEVLGASTEAGGGVVGALARTGAGIALFLAIGLVSLALGAVFVRRARTT